MAANFWESDAVVKSEDQWWSKDPEATAPAKDKGFFSNVGSLLVEGGKRAIGAAQVSPSVIAGDVGEDKAKLLSEQLSMKPSVQPKQLVEAQTAFKDEAEAFEKAKGFTESIGPFAGFLLEFGKQVITNPKGAVYLTAQSAANMAPQIAGMIAGGKGGALAGSLAGPGGAAVGAAAGAIGGGFAAGVPLEIGSEFIGRISEKLSERGLPPTEENIAALLRDKAVVEQAISEARTKGVTTAAVDSLMTVGAGKFATGARRSAIDAARKELGDVADAAQIAKRADELLKARTLTQKAGRGAGAVGIETAGGGISEAAGQLAAYGKVDLEDVGAEMLGELGGSAISVPAAAYSTTQDMLKSKAKTDAASILAEEEKARAETPPVVKPAAAEPSPTQAIEDQAAELERQQQRQQAAMERARVGGIGGGSEVNQTMLEQARIRKEQQERAAAAEEKAAEAERQRALRAERARIGSTQYSGDPMMNEVLRSRAIADFDAANAPKPEAPKPPPEYRPTKTIEQTTPIEQPKDFNVLRGVDARNADLMSAVAERRAAEQAAAATQAKTTEAKKVEEAAKVDTSRADVDQRVAQVENFLMSPVRKTQQETADYMAGVVPEMQKDFMTLFDEDMNQPLTPEQTEALKTQIRQRLQPDFIPDENVQRTPFKRFLAAKGMNKKDVQDIFGENAYRANQQLPGAIKADGPRLDMLAEAAVEAGFLQNEDTEALVDMIKAEFGGDEQVSVDMSGDRAAAEYEAQREGELESRAAVIGLKTKGMTPDQIAARLDRIERKREEKRKQYSRSLDGFADLPTADQDRIIDMMIDQFGEPQVFDVERAEIEGRVRDEEELLQTQTEQQLRDKQDEIDRLEKENERLSKEAERKAKADEQVGDFVLTGSKRDADEAAARGQEPMFAAEAGKGYNISAEDQRIEKELTGKSMIQAADWAVTNAPNAFAKVIAEKVRNRLREFQRKGMTLEFNISGGSTRQRMLSGARGVTQFEWGKDDKGSKITVTLNGAAVMDNQGGYPPGVQYGTILHELLHVATRSQFVFMPSTDPLKKQMTELFNAVVGRFNADAKAGTLPPVMEKYYKRMNNVLEDPDELLAWGLTDKDVQAYFNDIKVGEKSVFTRLVELIRTALGLGKPYESALERLVRTSESMLDVDVDAIDAMLGQRDKQIGVKKKPAGPMKQESLFQKEGSPAPNWVPEKIWRLHELMQRADDEAEGRVPLRENEQGRVPTSGALKRNQTMTFRRLNAAVDEYVGGDYQKSMDLMTRMNEESNRRADEDEGRSLEMRDTPKAPPTDSAAFKKWFGSSKVVDENGEPLVVSHITKKKGITTFDPSYKTELSSMGFHFGTPEQAEFRGTQYDFKSRGEPEVGQYYLSIKKPLRVSHMASYAPDHLADQMADMGILDDDSYAGIQSETGYDSVETGSRLVQILKDSGYDGLVYENEKEGTGDSYVPFDPTQIKSATENIGTYDPENADIRYQREGQPNPTRQNIFGEPVLGTWSITVDPKMELQDGLIYKLLDKNIDLKRIIEAVKSTGKEIATKWNPYLQEELYHGRTAEASKQFQDNEWLPLLQDMQKKDVTIGALEKYLLNRHAEDYNKLVAKRNPTRPEMQDGGSSVTTEAARKYLADLDADTKAKYEELAKRVDDITKGTRKLLVDTGYEKAETVEGWEKAFPNYVPLMREEMDFDYNFGSFGTGRGFDVRRDFSRSAMGSKRNVVDIIGNVIAARNNAIALTEKNRVAQAVYGLALEAPNSDFWMAINPEAEKIPEDAIDELRSMGLDEDAVKFLMKEPKQRMLDPKKNEVISRVNTKLRENDFVLATRVNGEKRYVLFNPKDPRSARAATALKNLDAQDLGTTMGMIAKVTRWMASVNTQYNPIFGPYNFLRDIQAGALQLSTTELAGQQKEIAKLVVPSMGAIYSSLRKRRKGEKVEGDADFLKMADLWKEFQSEGGQTGFRDNFSRTQDRTEALLTEMEKLTEGKLKASGRAVFDWLSDYNDSLENAVRLSAYKVAKEKFKKDGFSDAEAKQKAASLAKNLTVNFNRKGDVATQMGALYAFFNASMQGSARMIETLKGPTGKKIMAGGLLLGSMQALLLASAGFDDEEPPEFIRSKNILIPTGDGNYVAFPMPLGYHVIPGISRILTEWAMSGFKDTARRVTDLTGLFLDAFNPVGNAGWSVQTIAPTILDPLVALGENKDFTGKPISKEDMFSLNPTPGYSRAREGANFLTTALAEFLNASSGGDKDRQGVISPTPEQIEYLIGQATGGVGRELVKLTTTIDKTITGEELPPYKIPLYGRFVGETKSAAAESNKFYKNMKELNELNNVVTGRRERKEPLGDFIKENPQARLLPLANKTFKDVQELRKRRKALLERDAPKESIQAVEKQITRRMQVLNERVRAMEDRN